MITGQLETADGGPCRNAAQDLKECRRGDTNDWCDFLMGPLKNTVLGGIVYMDGFLVA